MMQAHRHWHLALWLILGPAMLVTLWLAVSLRPLAPVNDTLPPGAPSSPAESRDE